MQKNQISILSAKHIYSIKLCIDFFLLKMKEDQGLGRKETRPRLEVYSVTRDGFLPYFMFEAKRPLAAYILVVTAFLWVAFVRKCVEVRGQMFKTAA